MRMPQLSPKRASLARLTGALAAAAAFALAAGGTASAAVDDDAFTRLLQLNPGLSAAELERSMREAAATTGLTYDKAIMTALAEAESHARSGGSAGTQSDPSTCNRVYVGTAAYKGDIFYSASSTYGVSHGHTGIYSERAWITEARGSGDLSGEFYYSGRQYCSKIEKMFVSTSQTNRDSAGNYASAYLTGKPYNSNFAWNKGGDISTLNCSELVYKAYKRSVNIDLDGDGGLGVYPNDIKNSSLTVTYSVIG
ncbi:hypothetical protein [Thermoactinospora rubra]|uniref:hypothetical protein n=1 Tax=Thermoactinospora rubra TaxID=1088767 RepID=UPI00117DC0B8|nr:hypothetical protein [Thermoactinospora rubra]